MNRTYGKLWLDPETKLWTMKAEPHIMIKMKQVFGKVDKGQFGHVTLLDSDEVRRDLEWFLSRYDLDVSDQDWMNLGDGADRHRGEVADLEEIMRPDYKPQAFKMALPPRPYQAQVAEIVWKRGYLLCGDQVGLGKTVEAIACFTNPDTLPAIVVTLAGLLPLQWKAEIERFMPDLYVHIVKGVKPYAFPLKDGRSPDVVVISYSKLFGWAEHMAGKFKMIAFDEIQELRHNTSARYKAAKHIARSCKYVTGFSATPIFGYGGEIYNVLDALKENVLGTPDEFFREWCTTALGERKVSIRDPRAFGTYLRENFIMIRRTREEVGRQLPAHTKIPHRISSDRAALDAVKESAAALAKIILSNQKLSGFDKMKASEELSHLLRQATGIAKAPYCADFIRMMAMDGDKVVVFGWHREVWRILYSKLEDLHPVMITGAETEKEKIAAKKRFVSGDAQVIFISLRAGQGIDGLQHVANINVFAELDWAPACHEQAAGRIYRDGQKNPVTTFFLLADEGSDPAIAEALGLKYEQLEGIRNPEAELVEELQVDEEHIKRLAKMYLQKEAEKAAEPPENEGETSAENLADQQVPAESGSGAHVQGGLLPGQRLPAPDGPR